MKHTQKKTIYFIFKPSIATLDGWLPIMYRVKEQKKNIRIIGVFPNQTIASLINDKNILLEISNNIFEYVLIQRFSKKWFKVADLKSARKFSNISYIEHKILFIYKVLKGRNYIFLSKIVWFIFRLYDKFKSLPYSKYLYNINSVDNNNAVVFYDICKHYSNDSYDLNNALGNIKRFSIFHGPVIQERPIQSNESQKYINTTAYLFSDKEKDFYRKSYSLNDKQMKVVGVPRHDSAWFNTIIECDNKLNGKNQWKDYIYLVGRALQWNIPYDRKKKALYDIKELAFNVLNRKIIVKLHPKEKNSKHGDMLYYEIFGNENYEKKWIISDKHSFSLGADCLFSVTLNSSVSTDMVIMGVPIIEYYDTSKLNNKNYSKMFVDNNKNPVTEFNYYGFVLPASNYDELILQANRIINDRKSVIKELQSNYNNIFYHDNNAIENIVGDISKHNFI